MKTMSDMKPIYASNEVQFDFNTGVKDAMDQTVLALVKEKGIIMKEILFVTMVNYMHVTRPFG